MPTPPARSEPESVSLVWAAQARVGVRLQSAPAREEAEAVIWPAIWEATSSALGEGDWRPSMSWLDVIELLED
ncbi:MAG: hypothetical protein ACRDPY_07715 [Streptosporangiaceae bacterium]